eukprot:5695421-Pyramimonas_sp.AAC.1
MEASRLAMIWRLPLVIESRSNPPASDTTTPSLPPPVPKVGVGGRCAAAGPEGWPGTACGTGLHVCFGS